MIEITVKTKPDFTFAQREQDGIKVISNITGNQYSLIHGDVIDKFGKTYSTDIMFIMLLEYDESVDEYIYADNGFVNYVFGADSIYQLDRESLSSVCDYIREYEQEHNLY